MAVWDILLPRPDKAKMGDTALEKVADEICRNLLGLGLYVEARNYKVAFWEIVASSSRRMITLPGGNEASGIALLLAGKYDPPTLVFEEINSLMPGLGSKMVGAAIAALETHPGVFQRIRVNDLSPRLGDGRRWWEHIASAYPRFDWHITHEENLTHVNMASRRCKD
jgi:hypothetical protein